ncbi:Polyketide synthase PksN [Rosistilla oblonga]|uniref:SDR family NAD(P)-dependent oxidoreductase n=1 Tax=Rosistilla oblonga TaxID=2527990 RepID=UPI001188AD61|nr:SDR family NAD(P)-dependent oxidoreductase [Rosistilla oblonga]QDV13868.1 Polyketide synthase PksN [Rosistilla oblonga]
MNASHQSQARTFAELLSERAARHPERPAIKFLAEGTEVTHQVSYQQLHARAAAIGSWLSDRGLRGRPVLLVFPQSIDYAAAFFGCLYAGAIAVPAYPPRRNRNLDRLQSMASDSGADVILTNNELLESLSAWVDEDNPLGQRSLQSIDTLADDPQFNPAFGADPQAVAFLQYTSGSTGAPKGVIVTNRNLIENQIMITEIFGQREDEVIMCGWLPMYHDMGLIGNLLHPLYLGGHLVLMSPFTFFQKPLCWLQAISNHRATISGSPNFGYDMCVEALSQQERDSLDLSSWNLAFNGAEPVRHATLQRFIKTFQPHGFSPAAFSPCFGMAETTLIVSGTRRPDEAQSIVVDAESLHQGTVEPPSENPSAPPLTIVSSGRPGSDFDVRIVDPETRVELPEKQTGEVWVHGPSVTDGYWNKPTETQQTFQGIIAADAAPAKQFLRTGDLGFLSDGELYVTGRLKDTIIVAGANHYPSDIEETVVASHSALAIGGGVAFSIDRDDREQVFVAQELKRSQWRSYDKDEVISAVYGRVFQDHGLALAGIVLLRPGSIPKTTSGKLQRRLTAKMFVDGDLKSLVDWSRDDAMTHPHANESEPAHAEAAPTNEVSSAAPPSSESSERQDQLAELQAWMTSQLATLLQIAPGSISANEPLALYGLTSVAAVRLAGMLSQHVGQPIDPTLAYNFPTIDSICRHLVLGESARSLPSRDVSSDPSVSNDDPIAIIGMACRFPGAASIDEFWDLLTSGGCAIQSARDGQPTSPSGSVNPSVPTAAGYIDAVDQFDPAFFSISPREADEMDPRQRLAMEVSWRAIEHANIDPRRLAGSKTGVFFGASGNDYERLCSAAGHPTGGHSATGVSHAIIANRISYFLDLQGPSFSVDTACSSSLVAVHQAAEAIRGGQCDTAIAGGVNLILDPSVTNAFHEAGMLSPTGQCKTFAAGANGFVRGEGCGVVVLKRLSQAVADRDNVLCVLRGSAINQDGRSNGLTAPSGLAQQQVVRSALANGNVEPAEVQYVEAHGTGTELGDPIEIGALTAVFGDRPKPLLVGSVKTNIGHLEAAAGIAGVIKTALAIRHQIIPPHLGFDAPSPHIDWTQPIEVAPSGAIWNCDEGQLHRAGVSSFGFGGTNAHLILEAPASSSPAGSEADDSTAERSNFHLVKFSAKSDEALDALVATFMESAPTAELSAIAASANLGRTDFPHRLVVIASSTDDLCQCLGNPDNTSRVLRSRSDSQRPSAEQVRQSLQQAIASTATLDDLRQLGQHYVDGAAIDWRQVHPNASRRIDLPGHPMLRHRCWFRTQPAADAGHPLSADLSCELPLLGNRFDLAGEAIVFEADLSTVDLLHDHRLRGEIIFPTTGYVEQALSAARIASGSAAWEIEALQIARPLVISDARRCRIQILLDPQDNGYHCRVQHRSDSGWQQVASCQIVSSTPLLTTPPACELASPVQCSSADHYARCEALGLQYGPAFRGLIEIQSDAEVAVGRVALPLGTDALSSAVIHPALLDACLQTLAVLIPEELEGLWLPVGLQRFRFLSATPCRGELSVRSTLRFDQATASLMGDVWLLDSHDHVIAVVEGLRLENGQPVAPVSRYEEAWLPKIRQHEATAPPEVTAVEITAEVLANRGELLAKTGFVDSIEARQMLDASCQRWVIQCLVSLMGPLPAGKTLVRDDLLVQLGLLPEKHRSFERMLEMLVEDGLLARVESGWQTRVALEPAEGIPTLEVQATPLTAAVASEWALLQRCGSQLAEVLVGEVDPLDLLFPRQGVTAADVYKTSPGARTINAMLGQAIEAIVAELPDGRGLRVLEIGGGTGGTTHNVIRSLPAGRFHYTFTDIGASFLAAARQTFASCDAIDFRTLDIEQAPESQGFDPGSFDLVIAANVLHATRDLNQTVANARSLLSAGGQLLLLEGTRRCRWMDLTFGLTDGWWRFDDTIRCDYPMASESAWQTVLTENQFDSTTIVSPLPDDDSRAVNTAENVLIVATADRVKSNPTRDHWTIVTDRISRCQRLGKRLVNEGCTFELVDATADDFAADVRSAMTHYPGTQHIAFVASRSHGDTSEHARTASLRFLQTVQEILSKATGPIELALITSDAATDPTASALKGMLRSIALEQPDWRVRSIDAAGNNDRFSRQVAAEMLSGDAEPEVSLATDRRVRRLLLAQADLVADSGRVLRVAARGTLEGVRLESVKRREPGRREVEIAVLASGLNYRDVLLAMGMYPGEAPLGAECVGRITRLGRDVQSHQVGDLVIALGEETFADYVTVSAARITELPKGLGYAEAATVPVAFLTASFALETLGNLQPGQRVLIHSATGGVGLAAIQIARALGAEIFATASTSKHAVLRELGISRVFDSRSPGFATAIAAATQGHGVDLILDTLPESMFQENLDSLADGGVYIDITKPTTDRGSNSRFGARESTTTYHLLDLVQILQQEPSTAIRRLRAVLARFADGSYQPLPMETFRLSHAVDAMRQMQLARQIGKLVVVADDAPRLASRGALDFQELSIRKDAAYVIAGGLGDLGLMTAEYLSQRGAGLIALVQRSRPTAAQQAVIGRIENAGSQVLVCEADVADGDQVASSLRRVRGEGFPIAGVIHSAGMLRDAFVENQSIESFAQVFDVKAAGAWHLHQLTLDDPIDLFVVYSSLASVIGAPGQANHAAANAFLDGLVRQRMAAGLPATDLNWGPWGTIGEAARRGADTRTDMQGVGVIQPAAGALTMQRMLQRKSAIAAIAQISGDALPDRLKSHPLLEQLLNESVAVAETEGRIVDEFHRTEESQRPALMLDHVRKTLAEILGMSDSSRISASTVMTDIGLDSLTALELRDSLQTDLAAALPASLVYDYPSVRELSNFLLSAITTSGKCADDSKQEAMGAVNDRANLASGRDTQSEEAAETQRSASVVSVSNSIEASLEQLNAELNHWES